MDKAKKPVELKRIPYDSRKISQLSIARHRGACTINDIHYEYDREIVQQMHDDNDDNKLYKPDLVAYEDMNKGKTIPSMSTI